jgi:hypothetical protein
MAAYVCLFVFLMTPPHLRIEALVQFTTQHFFPFELLPALFDLLTAAAAWCL